MTHDANRVSMSFKRNDVVHLLQALEAVIEEFKYDGGLSYAEEYIRLHERIAKRLASHDHTPYRRTFA